MGTLKSSMGDTMTSLVHVPTMWSFLVLFLIDALCRNMVLGRVVQLIISLASLLRGQLVKCFTTL